MFSNIVCFDGLEKSQNMPINFENVIYDFRCCDSLMLIFIGVLKIDSFKNLICVRVTGKTMGLGKKKNRIKRETHINTALYCLNFILILIFAKLIL